MSTVTRIFEITYDPEIFDLTADILQDDLEVLYDQPVQVSEHHCTLPDGIQEALNSGDGVYRP